MPQLEPAGELLQAAGTGAAAATAREAAVGVAV
jgi:hypothetical protein